MAKSLEKWQFGDFQTPYPLVREVIQLLKVRHNILPEIIIDPSCGKGTFLRVALDEFPEAKIIGLDINKQYIEEAKLSVFNHQNANNLSLYEANFFNVDWETFLTSIPGYLLVIGNPPWVTSSELSVLNSQNLPSKSNFHNQRGIAAITGSGNFDISEWMILKYIEWLSNRAGTIAVLCKYSVARKILHQTRQQSESKFSASIYMIDAKSHFRASVAACLFVLSTGDSKTLDCKVYRNLSGEEISDLIGNRDGFILRDTLQYEKWRHLLGKDLRYIWRSGVKHDCAKIMELEQIQDHLFLNGMREKVYLETTYLYPLLKSSDIGNGRVENFRKFVLITQKFIGDDTRSIEASAPKTWQYLIRHDFYLKKRRSSIYRNQPPYSIFGIGPYSFKPWKVAISGLYKHLKFCLVKPLDKKPVMFDDTVNFLSFDTEDEAKFIFELLTSNPALEFLDSMIFWDGKRPITIDILNRLSLEAVAKEWGVLETYYQWNKPDPLASNSQLELELDVESSEDTPLRIFA